MKLYCEDFVKIKRTFCKKYFVKIMHFEFECQKIKFCWNTAMLTCLHMAQAKVAESNSCDRDHMAQKAPNVTSDPLQKKFIDPLSQNVTKPIH